MSGKSTRSKKFPRSRIKNYKNLSKRFYQMMKRCYDRSCPEYKNYGLRGIEVEPFLQKVGNYVLYLSSLPRQKGQNHIDRIDNDKGYLRGNLRWATCAENALNKRTTNKVNYNGKEMPFTHFVRDYCEISYSFARKLLAEGRELGEISNRKRKCLRPDKRRKVK